MITEDEIREQRLYLDVTGLSYRDLRDAYKSITGLLKVIKVAR